MRRAAVACALLLAQPSLAWEVFCRDFGGVQLSAQSIEASVCRTTPVAECQEGLANPRGGQYGEHTWLTFEAMRLAGLGPQFTSAPDALRGPAVGQGTFEPSGYFTDGVAASSVGPTYLPAGAGSMRSFLRRRVAIPEFSELPDRSHSLAEFLMGNEHCVPLNIPRTTEAELERCHSFKGHMGAVNATHWPPLNRAAYDLYHRLALDTAARCKKMMEAAPPTHLLASYMQASAKACEREALVYQSVASHYLEDAWATGHMFERWGSPAFARGPVAQLQNSVAAMTTGMIHGARALTGAQDRANLAGPNFDLIELDDANATRYRPSPTVGPYFGGGDLYLLQCNEHLSGWNVASGTRLVQQSTGMFTCLVRGFAEVYDAGPKTQGALSPDLTLDDGIVTSTDPACWNNLLTNRSMMFSLGLTTKVAGVQFVVTAEDLVSPALAAKFGLKRGVSKVRGFRELDVTDPEFDRESRRFRVALANLATIYLLRGKAAPTATDLAQQQTAAGLPSPALRDVFGVSPSARPSADFVDAVRRGEVEHFERKDSSFWSEGPVTLLPCASDADCDDFPGTYCDRTAVEGDQVRSRCVPQEAALLRAFRAAETPRWCREQTWGSMNAARRACQDKGAGSPECEACVQVIAPHLRNACDPGDRVLDPTLGPIDGRSVCDVYHHAAVTSLQGGEGFVHVPWEREGTEDADAATYRAALGQCLAGPRPQVTTNFVRSYEAGPEDALIATLTLTQRGYDHYEVTCGRDNGVHWDRVRHPASSPSGVVEITLAPTDDPRYPFVAPVAELELAVFQGPACTTPLAVVSGAAAPPGTTELMTSWNVVNGVADEICIRMRPLKSVTRTGHTLGVHRK